VLLRCERFGSLNGNLMRLWGLSCGAFLWRVGQPVETMQT